MFPIKRGRYEITARYDQPRPLSVPPAERTKIHGGWDISCELDEPILAPAGGIAFYHRIWRSSYTQRADWQWPDEKWYQFSNYYADTYGNLVFVEAGKYTYLFCHLEEWRFYQLVLRTYGFHSKVKEQRSEYNKWVRSWLTIDVPKRVNEGDVIGYVGNEGSSTAPHIHFELHPVRSWKQLDPAIVWPLL